MVDQFGGRSVGGIAVARSILRPRARVLRRGWDCIGR